MKLRPPKTLTYFVLVLSSHEHKELVYPSSWSTEHFDTIEECKEYWERTCKNRKNGDGHDAHYNNLPFIAEKYIETRELIASEENEPANATNEAKTKYMCIADYPQNQASVGYVFDVFSDDAKEWFDRYPQIYKRIE